MRGLAALLAFTLLSSSALGAPVTLYAPLGEYDPSPNYQFEFEATAGSTLDVGLSWTLNVGLGGFGHVGVSLTGPGYLRQYERRVAFEDNAVSLTDAFVWSNVLTSDGTYLLSASLAVSPVRQFSSTGSLTIDDPVVTPAVPEPSTIVLVGLGVALLGWRARRLIERIR